MVAFHMLLISIIKIILSNFDTIKILISPVERRVGTPITWPVHTELSLPSQLCSEKIKELRERLKK